MKQGDNGNSSAVNSPSKGFNILSVGNYKDSDAFIASSSSGLDPQINNEKPETLFVGSNITFADATVGSGTSYATPIASGFAADILSEWEPFRTRPDAVRAFIVNSGANGVLASAGSEDALGYSYEMFDEGFGPSTLDWLGNNTGIYYREGTNSQWSTFDSSDPFPNNGSIDFSKVIPSGISNIRVTLAYSLNGTWTYNHRTDVTPQGVDLDLVVYNQNGIAIGHSLGTRNSYETIVFSNSGTNTYRFEVRRYRNSDTTNKTRFALVISYI